MELTIVIICLLLIAFFSGMEIAYISSNKIYLEIEKKQHNFFSNFVAKLTLNPSKFLATLLLGNTIAIVVYGFYISRSIPQWSFVQNLELNSWQLVVAQMVLSTLIIIVTTEFISKLLFQIFSNSLIKYLSFPAYFFYRVLNYFSSFTIWISDTILARFFKSNVNSQQSLFSKVELENFINEQINSFSNQENVDSEIQIFQNALEFSTVKARDIMTPRTELVAVEIHSSVSQLREKFIQTGYSKLLIYQNTFDSILGYVHSFELFKKPRTIKNSMIPVEFIPETILIKDVLNLLTKKRKSVAVVLDEYGGTSGIITVEDIIEELFGEIDDEHDEDEQLTETQLDDYNYIFSTRLDVNYLNEEYDLEIPESDSYGTLGGFIVNFSKEIPQKGDVIVINNFQFYIEEASNNKIELVKMTVSD
ncbi:hemolysin family protein [Flavobacterium sp.]|uniref:hemolysin family protein n=1 Tax=Flavobacterium sp. TaxID=239 RepID=UPI002B4ADC2F|nr:hemolysin family protein [Flavobacterium sp.]HLP65339.1 hemolysin family protein [Flavobacterium sp.]